MHLKLLGFGLIAVVSSANAVEGMWTPEQLPKIAAPLKAAGLTLDPHSLADLSGQPMGAIVSLGGCSASFVSPDGLVVTNHHCAYGAIQLNSTEQNNLLRDGFAAGSRDAELSAGPGARVFVTQEIRDVSAEVTRRVKVGMSDRARYDAVEVASKSIVSKCESTPGLRCRVVSFFGGLDYRLVVQLEIRDVRLVYAPPNAIGSFGGEVDNWSWPRHTGDFAFYRAYVGPNGKSAAYSPDNRPFKSPRFLKLASQPLQEGDFVMVAGYPGTTSRHRTADEIAEVIGWTYPQQIQRLTELTTLVRAAAPENSDVAIKYAATVRGWENAIKNLTGQLAGFAQADALGSKRSEEGELESWLRAQEEGGEQAQASIDALRSRLTQNREFRERELVMATLGSSGLFSSARDLYRLSLERKKSDAERAPGFQKRDLPSIEARLKQLDRRLDPAVDRALLRHALVSYLKLPTEQRLPELDHWLQASGSSDPSKSIDAALDSLYAGTALTDLALRLDWLDASHKKFEASNDSFIQLAVTLAPALKRIEDRDKTDEGSLLDLRPKFMQAMLDFRKSRGLATYPDANSTLRITFGTLAGNVPKDGLAYLPFTHASGILAKHTGEVPFDATEAQIEAIREHRWSAKDGAVESGIPVNFLADLDVTGGNSGSATLNARGELVGLIFDMTWESVASNWVFNPALTRTIHLDARYMRWIMREVFPGPIVLQELELATQ